MSAPPQTRRRFLETSAAALSATALSGLTIARSAHAAGSDVIRIGMVGCGNRCPGAAVNAMNVDPGVRLVAMTDILPSRVQSRREMLKKQKPDQVQVDDDHCFSGLDGYKQVIQSVDVALIACAAKFHPMYLRAAVEAGKHVFVEKPHAIDPVGVREVVAAAELAKQKGLCVMSGLQSRWDIGYRETMKRVHDGAIGDIVAIEQNFLRGPYGTYKRQAEHTTDTMYQFTNQYHFAWLCGDDVAQSLVHNVDIATWAMHEQTPLKAHGMGGRSTLVGEIYGDVFDHHGVVYEYGNGVRMYAFCRTIPGCYNEYSAILLGSKGRCFLKKCTIEGQTNWRYQHPKSDPSPYDIEHDILFKAIRSGEPFNAGDYMARSTMVAILGQLTCYSGQEIEWEKALKSDFSFAPKPEDCRLDMEPPAKLGPDGRYAVVATPGLTKNV
jgi:myo-inositol 2-dehydrogenase / D-chiro-inositol 1-dehydrogenase